MPQLDHLFLGNALEAVDERGRMSLPSFIGGCLDPDRSEILFIGPHETDPCLTGFAANHAAAVYAETERLRLRDESTGVSRDVHFARARQAFGQVERARLGPGGGIRLTSWLRTRARIEDEVLVVGTGATFEIWNPALARQSDDPQLRELAAYRLEEREEGRAAGDLDEGESE